METLSRIQSFGGWQLVCRHESRVTGTPMCFAVYLPPAAEHGKVPVLWFLSGLTCTEANFTEKAGAQRFAAELGLALVVPDTSPRGEGVPDDPAYDLGQGAGFYLDATQAPWNAHFKMESWITGELRDLVAASFPADAGSQGIFGHSMGGHGALTLALRHPELYKSVSAFAPIVAPSQCPWGEKAFTAYLGPGRALWRAHDTCALIEDGARPRAREILVDQGSDDKSAARLRPFVLFHRKLHGGSHAPSCQGTGYLACPWMRMVCWICASRGRSAAPAGIPIEERIKAVISVDVARLSVPGSSAGIVVRMRSTRSPTLWPFQLPRKLSPTSGEARSIPKRSAPWHCAHRVSYCALPFSACAAVYRPCPATSAAMDSTA